MTSMIGMRTAGLEPSVLFRMTAECERQGGINLAQALYPLPMPGPVRDAAAAAMAAPTQHLGRSAGQKELCQAIAARLRRDQRIEVDPAKQVVVTAGATAAFSATCLALFDPGDTIVFFEPFYPPHLSAAMLAGLQVKLVPLAPPGFKVDSDALVRATGEGCAALVLSNPHNPTGKVFDEEELELIAELSEQEGFLVLSDETHASYCYAPNVHIPAASVLGLHERTVTIASLGNCFNTTGWRVGYAWAPVELATCITLVSEAMGTLAPTPLQTALASALRAPAEYYTKLAAAFAAKRDTLCAALTAAGMPPLVPDGGPFVLADVSHKGCRNAPAAAAALLAEARVAAVPGTAFWRSDAGQTFLRFCFAQTDQVLAEATTALRGWRV